MIRRRIPLPLEDLAGAETSEGTPWRRLGWPADWRPSWVEDRLREAAASHASRVGLGTGARSPSAPVAGPARPKRIRLLESADAAPDPDPAISTEVSREATWEEVAWGLDRGVDLFVEDADPWSPEPDDPWAGTDEAPGGV